MVVKIADKGNHLEQNQCWDLLRTHIFPRTRELPQFPISPKPLFLSKNRLRNPPKPVLKQNKKLCTYAQKKSLHICKSFFRKNFFATGLIFERFLAPRSRFFEKVNGLGVLGFSGIYEFSKDLDSIYIYIYILLYKGNMTFYFRKVKYRIVDCEICNLMAIYVSGIKIWGWARCSDSGKVFPPLLHSSLEVLSQSRSFENSYIPENPRTPKPLTFSKNRLRGAKNRSNISSVAKKNFRKNDFFFQKLCICANFYFVHMCTKNIKKSCTYAKVKKNIVFSEFFFQRIVMIKNVLEGSEVGFLKGITRERERERERELGSFENSYIPENPRTPPISYISQTVISFKKPTSGPSKTFIMIKTRQKKNLHICKVFEKKSRFFGILFLRPGLCLTDF
ncbi:hypothetical protein LXL04_005479 [Taraxacum kok-saghyz]